MVWKMGYSVTMKTRWNWLAMLGVLLLALVAAALDTNETQSLKVYPLDPNNPAILDTLRALVGKDGMVTLDRVNSRVLVITTRVEELPRHVTHLLCVSQCRVIAAGRRADVLRLPPVRKLLSPARKRLARHSGQRPRRAPPPELIRLRKDNEELLRLRNEVRQLRVDKQDLAGKLHGAVCVGTLCEGTIGGKPVRRYLYQITSHDESFARWGVQGTGWQTGASAACAVTQFARGEIAQRGVFPAEVLDPTAFMAEMTRQHLGRNHQLRLSRLVDVVL